MAGHVAQLSQAPLNNARSLSGLERATAPPTFSLAMHGMVLTQTIMSKTYFIFKYVSMCRMCMWILGTMEARDLRSPGAGVTGDQELPDMDAGNWTQVLCKMTLLTQEPFLQPNHHGFSHTYTLPSLYLLSAVRVPCPCIYFFFKSRIYISKEI